MSKEDKVTEIRPDAPMATPGLTPNLAQAALSFLNRVDMKGAESEAMQMVKNALHEIIEANQNAGS